MPRAALVGVVSGLVRGNGHGWTSPQFLGARSAAASCSPPSSSSWSPSYCSRSWATRRRRPASTACPGPRLPRSPRPITRLTLSYAPGPLEGIASGTSNALRQVGTVLGVAVLGSVVSADGGLGSPGQFTTGRTAALTVPAAIFAVSPLVILLAPETRTGHPAGPPIPSQRQGDRSAELARWPASPR